MPSLLARQVDSRGRVVLPKEFPPGSAVTIQQVDSGTWILKLSSPEKGLKIIAIPTIEKLEDDPTWEQMERKAALHLSKHVPPFEE